MAGSCFWATGKKIRYLNFLLESKKASRKIRTQAGLKKASRKFIRLAPCLFWCDVLVACSSQSQSNIQAWSSSFLQLFFFWFDKLFGCIWEHIVVNCKCFLSNLGSKQSWSWAIQSLVKIWSYCSMRIFFFSC